MGGVPRPLKAGTQRHLHLVFTIFIVFITSGARHDHGPAVRRSLLRRHRHRPRAALPQGRGQGRLLQPAELHRRHLRQVRPAPARRDRQEGEWLT